MSLIKTGRSVFINSIDDCDLKSKFMEMGLLKNKRLRIAFKAPFGDPIAIEIDGAILSLRLDEAIFIKVREEA